MALPLDNVPILNAEAGYALSAKHERIAEIIQDYDSDLHLAWIPPDQRGPLDKEFPFAVLHFAANGMQYIVHKYKESEVDERILADLFLRDNKNASVLDRLDAEDNARRLVKMKENMEQAELRQDFISTVMSSPLHRFKHNGKVFE